MIPSPVKGTVLWQGTVGDRDYRLVQRTDLATNNVDYVLEGFVGFDAMGSPVWGEPGNTPSTTLGEIVQAARS